jgi:hypothetical protein
VAFKHSSRAIGPYHVMHALWTYPDKVDA